MKKENTDLINNMSDLTIGHLFQLIRKIKFTALLSMFGILSSLLGGAYAFGKSKQQKDEAISLQSPFSMRLELEDKKFDFPNLTLVKDPMLIGVSDNVLVLSLREIRNEFDVIPIGKIISKIEKQQLSWPWDMFAGVLNSGYAHASGPNNFVWNGHNSDYNFKEEFIDNNTVNRFYSDGCILEYKVDTNRRSIPESFRWLKSVH